RVSGTIRRGPTRRSGEVLEQVRVRDLGAPRVTCVAGLASTGAATVGFTRYPRPQVVRRAPARWAEAPQRRGPAQERALRRHTAVEPRALRGALSLSRGGTDGGHHHRKD